MGIGPFRNSSEDSQRSAQTGLPPANSVNPDPNRWQIKLSVEKGAYVLLDIVYPNCTNFEGRKLLVFRSSVDAIRKQKVIDPHFGDDKKLIYPIARFQPTDEGFSDAMEFLRMKFDGDADCRSTLYNSLEEFLETEWTHQAYVKYPGFTSLLLSKADPHIEVDHKYCRCRHCVSIEDLPNSNAEASAFTDLVLDLVGRGYAIYVQGVWTERWQDILRSMNFRRVHQRWGNNFLFNDYGKLVTIK